MALETIDGGGVSKLRDVIRQLGYNKDVDVEIGTVTAPLPDIRVKLDNVNFELEREDIVIVERLKGYTRTVRINGVDAEIEFPPVLEAGDRVVLQMFNAGQDYVILDRLGGDGDGA
ncbi:Protein of unknown function [Paenibacillus sp. CF095]|uniref:DUF2577 family protein n=1 Tax=Paenibacillus sp. CF095 TaxID=1881033 RepID=UPI0008886BC3|nr:DUF2577 family protein [Paenibacillus sp. CF095]SDC86810.1 Protein of unknown function [Paenibacillus sp. CF095]